MEKSKFNNDIASIKEAIDHDRLVIFAGAGISKDSGIPLWSELEQGIKNHLNEKTTSDDPLKIAQLLYNEKGEKEYNDILKSILFKDADSYNPLHEILFELNPQHIITTNFDHYFESIINDLGLPFSIVSKDIDLPYAKHKKLLIKYHGDFENHNIVLKENDYLNFSKDHTLKEVFAKSLFSNKTILFVGYSVKDPNLKILIKEIQYLLNKHYQRAYLLTSKEEISHAEFRYFEDLGINLLVRDNDGDIIDYPKTKKLSGTGAKVYSLLKYISGFQVYSYRNSLDHDSLRSKTIDELYNSLQRFSYFRVLPQRTLASLYPISKDSKQEPGYLVINGSLKLFNQDLYQLIADYKGMDDPNFTDEEKRKLNYCLGRIALSGIRTIGRTTNMDATGGHPIKDEIDFHSNIETENECECIDCTLKAYDYALALKKVFEYHIDDRTSLWDDLVYFYGLYRLQDLYRSYQALKAIVTKANRLNRMEVSFMAKYNLTQLKWLLGNELFNDRIDWQEIERIQAEIDEIDLDQELDKVKYFVDRDVYIFLKEIKEGIYIQRLCNEIDETFVKVPKTVKAIQRGGFHSSNVFGKLYDSVSLLKGFLEHNFLLHNGFSPIAESFGKSINTFTLGYYLKAFKEIRRHQIFGLPHIEEFNLFMFRLIVENSNHKEVVTTLVENEIDSIQVSKASVGKILTQINGFFKSSFNIPTVLGTQPRGSKNFIAALKENTLFRDLISKHLNGILIVMAYFDFNREQLKGIYENLIPFITHAGLSEENHTSFIRFLKKKQDLIEASDLEEILEIFESQQNINQSYITIIDILRRKRPKFKREINLDYYQLDRNQFNFPIVFKVLPSDKKREFRNRLATKLKNNKDAQLYFITISEGVIRTNQLIREYKSLINPMLQIGPQDENRYEHEIRPRIRQFFDLVNRNLLDTSGIDVAKVFDDEILFLLDPKDFDPKKFQCDWLRYYILPSFHKRYAQIEYIGRALETTLEKKYDSELAEFYFAMKKWT